MAVTCLYWKGGSQLRPPLESWGFTAPVGSSLPVGTFAFVHLEQRAMAEPPLPGSWSPTPGPLPEGMAHRSRTQESPSGCQTPVTALLIQKVK